jgi:hypothetical protein
MASVGNGIRINRAISNSVTTTGTLYTANPNTFAILNVFVNTTSGVGTRILVFVDGQRLTDANPADNSFNVPLGYIHQLTAFVGPGQSVAALFAGNGVTGLVSISGVEFINT